MHNKILNKCSYIDFDLKKLKVGCSFLIVSVIKNLSLCFMENTGLNASRVFPDKQSAIGLGDYWAIGKRCIVSYIAGFKLYFFALNDLYWAIL